MAPGIVTQPFCAWQRADTLLICAPLVTEAAPATDTDSFLGSEKAVHAAVVQRFSMRAATYRQRFFILRG